MGYYSAINKGIPIRITTWINLEDITVSEANNRETQYGA